MSDVSIEGSPAVAIWRLAGDQQGVLLRSIGYKALQGCFDALPIAALIWLINAVRLETLTGSGLLWATLGVLACVAGQWLAGYLANRSAWIATFELFGSLRARLLRHVRRLPMSVHDHSSTGDMTTVLTQDISAVENFAHEPMQVMVGAAIAPLIVFVVLLGQDAPMAFAAMLSVALAVPVFLWSNGVFARLAARRQDLQADAAGRMLEYIQGLPVIRAFGMSGEKLALFDTALRDFRGISMEMTAKLAPLGSAFLTTVLLGIPLIVGAGTYWLFTERLDVGVFIIFAVLSLRVYGPLLAAANGVESMRIAEASLARIGRLLNRETAAEPAHETPLPTRYDVEFSDVGFAYAGADTLFENLNLSAPAAAVTAIVGPSGAGKTTLLQLVAGLRTPDRGRVVVGGVDLADLSANQRFELVTCVFQDVYLFPGTIYDNIAFGRASATSAQVERAARLARADEFIRALPDGYDSRVDEGGANLSGGERQRISIARAILKDAPIVLLDEATASLDPTNERYVQEALTELVANKTVLVVAHRLATIRNADQILVLADGAIRQRGRHDELLEAPGLYQALWDARERASSWQPRP
ncbi:MAG: ABC transporter ATP-binding protein [Pseudomonadota bacterium]